MAFYSLFLFSNLSGLPALSSFVTTQTVLSVSLMPTLVPLAKISGLFLSQAHAPVPPETTLLVEHYLSAKNVMPPAGPATAQQAQIVQVASQILSCTRIHAISIVLLPNILTQTPWPALPVTLLAGLAQIRPQTHV